jgi:hypothetical protein
MNRASRITRPIATPDILGLARLASQIYSTMPEENNNISAGESHSRNGALILLFVLTASFPLFAGDAPPLNLGSGEPGLGIIYESANEYVIFIDEGAEKSWKPGDYLDVDFRNGPLKIVAARNFGPEKLSPDRSPLWNTENLFPFDEETVFTSFGDPQSRKGFVPRETKVFSTNGESVLISRDVDALARARYGLTTNQWFLGRLGINIFYLETGKQNIVFYRNAEEKQAAKYFKLPKADDLILGVTKAMSPSKDVGIFAARTLSWHEWHMNSNAQAMFIEFSFKDAKQVKGKQ